MNDGDSSGTGADLTPEDQTSVAPSTPASQPHERSGEEESFIEDLSDEEPHTYYERAQREVIARELRLAKTDVAEWPSIPELASDVLLGLSKLGLDGYDRKRIELMKQFKELRKEAGLHLDLKEVNFATVYDRLLYDPDTCEGIGAYPVPDTITGERAVLVLGDPSSDDWQKRIPYLDSASSREGDLTAMTVMTLATAATSLDMGNYLERKALADEKSLAEDDKADMRGTTLLESVVNAVRSRLERLDPNERTPEVCRRLLDEEVNRIPGRPAKFVLALTRYRRRDFDAIEPEDQLRFLEQIEDRMMTLFEAVRRLDAELEYGTPDQKKQTPKMKYPEIDVKSAILCDVYGLSQTQIASRWGIKPSESDKIKGGTSTVAKAIRRGREILQKTLGQETWERLKREIPGTPNEPPNDKTINSETLP